MCATAVVFPCAGLCLSLVGQPLEWYHANHVFGPIYMAVVPFRPQLPAPSCDGSSVAHPRCVGGSSSGLAHSSPPHSPPPRRGSPDRLVQYAPGGTPPASVTDWFLLGCGKILVLVQIKIKSDPICVCSAGRCGQR